MYEFKHQKNQKHYYNCTKTLEVIVWKKSHNNQNAELQCLNAFEKHRPPPLVAINVWCTASRWAE